tara:strand:+ start:763 stop:1179 length:417 start_codon:yes stop_codon:yes gene_type:complete
VDATVVGMFSLFPSFDSILMVSNLLNATMLLLELAAILKNKWVDEQEDEQEEGEGVQFSHSHLKNDEDDANEKEETVWSWRKCMLMLSPSFAVTFLVFGFSALGHLQVFSLCCGLVVLVVLVSLCVPTLSPTTNGLHV